MTRRNRTQVEHATFEEQTSTHIQLIVSAIEASNKNLQQQLRKKMRKQKLPYVRKIKKQEKHYEKLRGISRNACGNEKERSLRKPNTRKD